MSVVLSQHGAEVYGAQRDRLLEVETRLRHLAVDLNDLARRVWYDDGDCAKLLRAEAFLVYQVAQKIGEAYEKVSS